MSSQGFPRAMGCAFDKNRLTCHSLVKSNFSKLGQGLAENVSEHLCKKNNLIILKNVLPNWYY
jgi:hypothetical protein